MTINERLAKFAGADTSIHRDEYGEINYGDPPAYDASLDLLRRDVLPRLSEEHWDQLDEQLVDYWDPNHPWAWYILTIPAAELAPAVAEVIES